eukprot:2169011-Alexandrium_andersonii.AAC.1
MAVGAGQFGLAILGVVVWLSSGVSACVASRLIPRLTALTAACSPLLANAPNPAKGSPTSIP